MAFEWKLIGEDSGAAPAEQPVNPGAAPVTPAIPAAAQPIAQAAPAEPAAAPAASYQPTDEAVPGLPRCEVHNAAVNTTEKSGYNGAYDSEVYASYDTGVNAEENAVVA